MNSGTTTPRFTDFYYALDGKLFRKSDNREMGWLCDDRYLMFDHNEEKFFVHRVLFFLYHGYFPEVVDHRDRNKLNNSKENLREGSKSLNEANTGPRVTNKVGYKGVCKTSDGKKYRATLAGKHLGHFESAEVAARVYDQAAVDKYGEYAFTNFNREEYKYG